MQIQQMEPDAQTLAELRQQCKTWGWDFDETLAEWKLANCEKAPVAPAVAVAVAVTAAPKPSKRAREDLFASLDSDIVGAHATATCTLFQSSTKPRSLDDATWEHVEMRGWNQVLIKDLGAHLWALHKQKKLDKVLGFIGDVATGKTLWCELFAAKYKFTLLPIHETDPDLLKEWLELSVNPSLLDPSPRLWVCEHWDAYADTASGRVLKKYWKKMLRTGIVVCTAWTGLDTRVQTTGIETWYRFSIPNTSLALRQGAKRANIELGTADAARLLEFVGGDLSAALSTLQYFGGAPPPSLDLAKSFPPPNLRVLINQSLTNRSASMMRLLAETDDMTLAYLFQEIAPEGQCLAAQCLSVDARGNHDHDMWACAGDLTQTWRVYDTVSFCDAAAGYDAKIWKNFITGPLHSAIPQIKGKTLTPLQIPTPQIVWKQSQPQIKQRQKKVMDYYGYGISKDHVISTFTKGREKKEEEDALDIYSFKVADSKALPGASVLLWSRDIADPRLAPDIRDRTLDLIGEWPEKKHKVRIGSKWVEKGVWD